MFGLSGSNELLLEVGWLREAQSDLGGGQSMVAVDDAVKLVSHLLSVKWVEENLLVLLAIEGHSGGLSSDVGWEDL